MEDKIKEIEYVTQKMNCIVADIFRKHVDKIDWIIFDHISMRSDRTLSVTYSFRLPREKRKAHSVFDYIKGFDKTDMLMNIRNTIFPRYIDRVSKIIGEIVDEANTATVPYRFIYKKDTSECWLVSQN